MDCFFNISFQENIRNPYTQRLKLLVSKSHISSVTDFQIVLIMKKEKYPFIPSGPRITGQHFILQQDTNRKCSSKLCSDFRQTLFLKMLRKDVVSLCWCDKCKGGCFD